MKICEKCKRQESQDKGFFICGAWYCDKCASSCVYCGVPTLFEYLVKGMCPDCQYISDDYEMESFNELLF